MDRAKPFSCDAIGGKQRIGSLALRGDNHGCSPTGGFCKGVAGQWEPDEALSTAQLVRNSRYQQLAEGIEWTDRRELERPS